MFPINEQEFNAMVEELSIMDLSGATIRQINSLAHALMSAETPGGDEPRARLSRIECDETDIVANLRKGPKVVAA